MTRKREALDRADGFSFGVLGPLLVTSPDGPVTMPMGRERAVLAQLLARIGQPVSVDVLVEGLWPATPPASAERTLHAHVARLRSRLEPGRAARQRGLIVTSARGYLLDADVATVDAGRFEALVDGAARGANDPTDLRTALQLWRGRAYDGFDDVGLCAQEGRRLDALRLAAIELRNDAELARGPDVALIAELESLVVEHPLRERFWEQLMVGLYRVGRQSEALAAYKRARRTLIDDMGVEPGPALRHLEAAILDHDVGLLSPRRAQPPRSLSIDLDAGGRLLTGRDEELIAVDAYWTATLGGQGGFVALLGPEGIGKTRLASEVAARVFASGGIVMYGRCDHAMGGPRPLFDAALRSQGSSLDEIPPGPDGLAAAVAQHLAAWRGDRPALIVFDDLHLADNETLVVVAEFAEWCASMPVLILGAFRADDVPVTSTRHLGLAGLGLEAVGEICRLYRSEGWTSAEVSQILEASAGVPLHVHREAAAAAERGAVEQLDADVERLAAAQTSAASSRTAATDAVLSLRRLIERRRRQSVPSPVPDRDLNPYRGLSRYDEHDVEWFFGRDRLVAELVVRVASSNLLAVAGPSGVGKSSLIRAGVLAALSAGALPGSQGWRRAVMTPGDDPLAALSAAAAGLHFDGLGLLVVDQSEELFTLGHDTAIRREFLGELDRLAGTTNVKVVIVVRSDHLGSLGEHPAIAARVAEGTTLVGAPTGAEIRQVVEGPAARAGLTVERALADEVVADAADAFGALPLVSTALAETWERRTGNELTLAGYALSGRVAGAVARLAEDTWSSMSADVQAVARRILLRLVRPVDGSAGETRLRARPQDVAPPDHPAATEALRTLVDRRLLMLDGETVEITHDALLRAWPRLADWLAQDVDSRRLHHHIAASAAWWADGGHADDDLLRGARLAAAIEWRDSGGADELNEIEHRYLEASVGLSDEQLARAHREAERQSQTNRRLRVLAGAIALLLVAATIAGAVAVRQADHADQAALEADAERLGALSGLERDLDRSLLLAVQATEMADTASTTGALLGAVQRSPRAVGMIRSERARLLALQLDPSGSIIAVDENLGGVTLYEVATSRRIGHWGTTNALQALAWSPDGTAFATVDMPDPDSTDAFDVVVVDTATLTERARYTGRRDPLSDVAFSPDGRRLVAAPGDQRSGRTPELTVWDVANPGPPARRVELPDATIEDEDQLSFDVTGHQVAVSVVDTTAIIDLDTGERTASVEGGGGVFGPDGRTIAVNRDAGTLPLALDLVDLATGQRRPLLGTHDERILHRAFSRDGAMLATAADDRTVRVWETATGRELFVLAGHTGRVLSAEFSPDGTWLYSTGLDRTIITWDLGARRTIERTLLPSTPGGGVAETMAFTSDESTFVAIGVGNGNGNAQLIAVDLASGRAADAIDTDHGIGHAVLASGGSTVITGGKDNAIRRWNVSTGELLAELTPDDDAPGFFPFAVTSDAETVYLQTAHDTIQAYDADSLTARPGTEVDVGAGIITGAISPDGHTLAVSTFDPSALKLVDVATSGVRSLDVPGDVTALGFSPDGSVVAAGDGDGRVFRIDVSAAALIGDAAVSHDGPVVGIAYSGDGRQYTSDSTDGTVGLWDADGQLLGAVQPGPPNDLARSKWSTDGRTLLVTYSNMSAFAFDIRPESWVDYACATAGRRLTEQEWSEVLPDRSYDPACT